ncbi:hypothetical protein T07_1348 [Trichinella nelsoni]|uniref:Uncharacterized protein n=1 Tax=Trichinella nelsoni TaxID=6336 RepID=A0A0V0SDU5_9BILA|nr:hypothetical protein T07_1348 [Trichinella nelsoni]
MCDLTPLGHSTMSACLFRQSVFSHSGVKFRDDLEKFDISLTSGRCAAVSRLQNEFEELKNFFLTVEFLNLEFSKNYFKFCLFHLLRFINMITHAKGSFYQTGEIERKKNFIDQRGIIGQS